MSEMNRQIREALKDCGLSLNQISRETGVDPAQLSRFIRGERDMTLATIEKMADVIGVKLVRTKPKKRGSK